jgi:hypothetical protein
MPRVLILATVLQSVWLGSALAGSANNEAACAATAFKHYLSANEALKDKQRVEDQIAQRRLQEQFCLRFVQCIAQDKGATADAEPASRFADCLREEAIELYKLYKD